MSAILTRSTLSTPATARFDVGAAAPEQGRTAFLPEIHLLRAIAIILVLAFHLGALRGGFVGVDVFFVVSGYLMTAQLVSRARSSRVGFADFYARRARRLLPAALAVVVVTALAGVLLLPATQRAGLTDDARASTLFAENWLLAARQTDYLADGLAASPLQHFWSLAVEEQFYLVWPGLIAACLSLGRRHAARALRVGIGAVLVGSFVVCLAWGATGSPAAYEATPTRAWELAAGGLLAVMPCRWGTGRSERLRRGLVWGGLAAVLVAALALDGSGGYPDARALVPVAGASAVVAAARPGVFGLPAAIAARQPVRWIGDASYSLYLWHWPMLVLLAGAGGTASGPARRTAAVVVAVCLAAATRRWIEVPALRSGHLRGHPGRVVLAAGLALALALGAAAVPRAVNDHELSAQRAASAALLATPPSGLGAASISDKGWLTFVAGSAVVPVPAESRTDVPARASRCKSAASAPTTPRCVFGDPASSTTVVLVGDSHMEQYVPAFELLAKQYGWRILSFLHSSCPFSAAQRVSDQARGDACLRANARTLQSILSDASVDLVVTSGRSAVPWVEDGTAPSPVEGLVDTWGALVARHLPVVAIRDNPLALPADATQACVADHLATPDVCDRAVGSALPYDPQIQAASRVAGVRLLDLTPAFCVQSTCPAVIGNVLVNRDEQHLTATYARSLAPRIGPFVDALLTAP